MTAQRSNVVLFTAGACDPNPGPGGWGLMLKTDGAEIEMHGSDPETKSGAMELMAVVQGLEQLTQQSRVQVISASSYICNGINSWRGAWKRRGWKKRNGEEIENRSLWERLDAALKGHEVQATRRRDGARHREDERACELAAQGAGEAAERRMVEGLGPGPAAMYRSPSS
ncbi:ribonuclease HI [Actinomadura sp. KC216]|uniref:ribonuclease H family protein n=1 Tax=Actinomadura sp. KC216 TaxID=2530370 RepID=UPI001042C85C|nr:ribonuclease H [Actinomadura sp. KC216]TDB91017.1 ribonuclease HI [Actinomadura sp. KC216]